jgi:hypothetical protein
MKLVELYFTDQTMPAGLRFLGAVLMLPDPDNDDALADRAWRLGINPGGTVLFFDQDSDDLNGFTAAHLDRLLTESECLALGLFSTQAQNN